MTIQDIIGAIAVIVNVAAVVYLCVVIPRLDRRMKHLERQRALKSPEMLKYTLPAFGDPVRVLYRSGDYEEPLRCAGKACGNRSLIDGELFYQIPLPNQGDGAIIPLCLPCGYPSLKEA